MIILYAPRSQQTLLLYKIRFFGFGTFINSRNGISIARGFCYYGFWARTGTVLLACMKENSRVFCRGVIALPCLFRMKQSIFDSRGRLGISIRLFSVWIELLWIKWQDVNIVWKLINNFDANYVIADFAICYSFEQSTRVIIYKK